MIPTHITVYGDAYLVTRATDEELVDAWADTSFAEGTMRVAESVENDRAALRYLGHEIVHVGLQHSGLVEFLDEKLEEAVCDALGYLLVDVIRENPAFVEAVREAYAAR